MATKLRFFPFDFHHLQTKKETPFFYDVSNIQLFSISFLSRRISYAEKT